MRNGVTSIRFVPSRVDGLADVSEVVVYPDRLVIIAAGRVVVFAFRSMAQWPRPAWLWRFLDRFGVRPRRRRPVVGDRDWFRRPPEGFFTFYTDPPLTVCMPADEFAEDYANTYFWRIQEVMLGGGFRTFDLG